MKCVGDVELLWQRKQTKLYLEPKWQAVGHLLHPSIFALLHTALAAIPTALLGCTALTMPHACAFTRTGYGWR